MEKQIILEFAGLVFATYGIIVMRIGFKSYNAREFLGFSQLHNEYEEDQDFSEKGILRYIRHPLYAGGMLVLIGFWLYIPNLATLITAGTAILYTFIGISLEEKKLIKQYGNKYRDYRQRVPMLIPSWSEIFKK